MNNIFKYLSLAIEFVTVVPEFIAMFEAKQSITGVQVQAAIQPALSALQGILPKLTLNSAIVLDFCNAFADTFNQYVVGSAKTPATV